jgi:hypothetical protein
MDVLRLDSATFLPNAVVEGYATMIWTERFDNPGDFEMKTSKIVETRNALPVGSLISLRDSYEVMFVENHSLTRTDGVPELVLTGRTFETFLENRAMYGIKYGDAWATLQPYTDSELASLLVWNYLANPTGEDVTRPAQTIDPLIRVQNLVVTDSSPVVDTAAAQSLSEGEVYARLRELLKVAQLGVRTSRPHGTLGAVISFDATRTATRGTVKKTMDLNVTELAIDIYRGVDRRRNQTLSPPVVFRYDAGHFVDPNYVSSIQDYRNIVLASTSDGSSLVTLDPNALNTSGLNRRIIYIDGGKRDPDAWYGAFVSKVKHEAYTALHEHAKAHLFDGEIAPDIQYVYKRHYALGDMVTVIGESSFVQDMIVNEYIRIYTAEGENGYPGLVEYDPLVFPPHRRDVDLDA